MNKICLIALLLISACFASLTYTVDVDRSGFTHATLSLDGAQNTSITLPSDATDFMIAGGAYRLSNGTAFIEPGVGGFTTFSFTTDLLTTKTASGWRLSFIAPADASVQIYLPEYSVVGQMEPAPRTVSSEGARTVLLMDDPGPVTIDYHLVDIPTQDATDPSALGFLAVAAVIIAVCAGVWFLTNAHRKPQKAGAERPPTTNMTPGKRAMMETLNGNDMIIVNLLISKGGRSRRNELERRSGISKSSLAMALNRLEKRKLVEIDRTSTTHFIRLSESFLRL